MVKTEKLKVTITGDGKFTGTGEAKNITVRVMVMVFMIYPILKLVMQILEL